MRILQFCLTNSATGEETTGTDMDTVNAIKKELNRMLSENSDHHEVLDQFVSFVRDIIYIMDKDKEICLVDLSRENTPEEENEIEAAVPWEGLQKKEFLNLLVKENDDLSDEDKLYLELKLDLKL